MKGLPLAERPNLVPTPRISRSSSLPWSSLCARVSAGWCLSAERDRRPVASSIEDDSLEPPSGAVKLSGSPPFESLGLSAYLYDNGSGPSVVGTEHSVHGVSLRE